MEMSEEEGEYFSETEEIKKKVGEIVEKERKSNKKKHRKKHKSKNELTKKSSKRKKTSKKKEKRNELKVFPSEKEKAKIIVNVNSPDFEKIVKNEEQSEKRINLEELVNQTLESKETNCDKKNNCNLECKVDPKENNEEKDLSNEMILSLTIGSPKEKLGEQTNFKKVEENDWSEQKRVKNKDRSRSIRRNMEKVESWDKNKVERREKDRERSKNRKMSRDHIRSKSQRKNRHRERSKDREESMDVFRRKENERLKNKERSRRREDCQEDVEKIVVNQRHKERERSRKRHQSRDDRSRSVRERDKSLRSNDRNRSKRRSREVSRDVFSKKRKENTKDLDKNRFNERSDYYNSLKKSSIDRQKSIHTSKKMKNEKEDYCSKTQHPAKNHLPNESIKSNLLNHAEQEYVANVEYKLEVQNEDDDAIIEKRRLERKKLLDSLCNSNQSNQTLEQESMDFKRVILDNVHTNDVSSSLKLSNSANHNNYNSQLKPFSPAKETNPPVVELINNSFEINCSADRNIIDDMFDDSLFTFNELEDKESNFFVSLNKEEISSNNLAPILETDVQLSDNWDDSEGYYRVRSGELLDSRYLVYGVSGKGVFSTVLRVRDTFNNDKDLAIKIIRNNEHMEKAGLKEIEFLEILNKIDHQDKHHVVRMHRSFSHRNHLCIVFEGLSMNLREVLKKYGKGVGLHMKAVKSYAQQLFLALKLLKKVKCIHADIKPDNILVDERKSLLKLADLGSALFIQDIELAPLLVSRFYRCPEVMLGVSYDYGVDLWSVACTLFELYTGNVLFPGKSNNDMLYLIQKLKGRISNKVLRKAQLKNEFFDEQNDFLFLEVDKNTQKEIIKAISIVPRGSTIYDMVSSRKKEYSDSKLREWELKFADLLDKCLIIDPSKRITITDILKHPFLIDRYE